MSDIALDNTKKVDSADNIDKTVRVSKITKGLNRKVWTAKYEGIEICSHVEETIEWTTLEERQKKLDAISQHVINDFKRTFNTAITELGLSSVSIFGSAERETEVDTTVATKSPGEVFDAIE